MTKEQAIRLAAAGWWRGMDARDVALLQLRMPR